MIDSQIGLDEPIDGIVGLCQGHELYFDPSASNSGPLLVEALADDEIINQNKFSFYFEPMGGISWLDLGEPNESNVKSGSSFVDTQLIKDFYWSFESTGLAIGSIDNAFGYGENPSSVGFPFEYDGKIFSIVDTGAGAFFMYAPYFESFITKIFEYAGVDDYEFNQFYGAVFTSC